MKYQRFTKSGCEDIREGIRKLDVWYFPKGIFAKWQVPKGIFPRVNFPNVQFPKRQLTKSVLAAVLGSQPVLVAALGPLAHPCRSAWPPIAAYGASEGLT